MSSKETFFAAQRFAVVGDSRTHAFPALTKRYLEGRGKTVYAVDLAGDKPGFLASVADVPADVEAAVIEVDKARTADVVKQVLDQGIKNVWMHQMTDTPEALELCKERGVALETGGCAVMYNAPSTSMHVLHRAIWKLIGRY